MKIKNDYIYFDSKDNIKYSTNLYNLRSLYFSILNKDYLIDYREIAELSFDKNMENDGYYIVYNSNGSIYYFIDPDHKDNVYKNIKNKKVLEVFNNNINRNNFNNFLKKIKNIYESFKK